MNFKEALGADCCSLQTWLMESSPAERANANFRIERFWVDFDWPAY